MEHARAREWRFKTQGCAVKHADSGSAHPQQIAAKINPKGCESAVAAYQHEGGDAQRSSSNGASRPFEETRSPDPDFFSFPLQC
eukprot:959493-Rhodomonas_salina.3